MAQGTDCSFGGSRSDFQHPRGSTELSGTPVPEESNTLFYPKQAQLPYT